MCPVVRVKFIENHVLKAQSALFPERSVFVAQQQLVEHLVVGEQDVRCCVADDATIIDQPRRAHLRSFGVLLSGIDGSGYCAERLVSCEELGETFGLVLGQRVHWVEDQCFHAGHAGLPRPKNVVEDRVEERLCLP